MPNGLRFFDEAVTSVAPVEGLEFNGLSPWVLLAASASLVARVRYGSTPTDRVRAVELRDMLVEQHLDHSEGDDLPYLDFPLNGVLVAAVGVWAACEDDPEVREAGLRLLAVADRWAYNRSFPVMSWASLTALAARENPGRLDAMMAEYADRSPTDLVEETRALLHRVGPATSSS